MKEHGQDIIRGVTHERYVNAIGEGAIVSRRDVANLMGVSYTTALYHLERAVKRGLLNKRFGYASDNQPGWVYALPATMPRLEGV